MYEVMENRHNFSEIQNLQTGQSILISKYLGLDEKIKVRFFESDTKKSILKKRLKDGSESESDTNREIGSKN